MHGDAEVYIIMTSSISSWFIRYSSFKSKAYLALYLLYTRRVLDYTLNDNE